MSDHIWHNFSDKRPDRKAIFVFKLDNVKLGGLNLDVEWSNQVEFMGMGYEPAELWPSFSHWDGYNRTVPNGLKWRELKEDEKYLQESADKTKFPYPIPKKERLEIFHGLDLGICPFCNSEYDIEWSPRYIGAPIFKPDNFRIQCHGCGLVDTGYITRLDIVSERMRTRK
jgi:hypothetical protein